MMLRSCMAMLLSLCLIMTVNISCSAQTRSSSQTILVVGDSLSAGYGIDVKHGWVALLAKRLAKRYPKFTVINSSISGDTTSNGLIRLPSLLKKYKPIIVIIELGGNDGLRGLNLRATEENIRQMILLSKKANAHVLLLGVRMPPNYGADFTKQFQQMFVQLAKQYDVAVVPQFLKNVAEHRNLMQADDIHPTQQAQPQLLANVWPTLQDMLKSITQSTSQQHQHNTQDHNDAAKRS